MTRIAGISTQTNSKGIVTKITVDLKKHPKAKEALTQIGLIAKSNEDLEREAFYKEFNDPTNLTLDELQESMLKHLDTLPWKS